MREPAPHQAEVDLVGQARREALRETLGGIAADLTARAANQGGTAAVTAATNNPDGDLHQVLADRDLVIGADDETVARIEGRWLSGRS